MGAVTVTAVQGVDIEQLSVSSLSVTTPPPDALDLSAQARMYIVPAVLKVILFEEVALAPLAKALIFGLTAKSVTPDEPLELVEVWNRFGNETPVPAVPMFEIRELKVTGTPRVTPEEETLLYTSCIWELFKA
jgi:hypothetical protein